MFATSSTVRFTANGVQFMSLGFNGSGGGNSILILEGTALDPALIGASNTNSGIYFGNRIVGISANTLTNSIFTTDGSNNQQWQPNNANANTTAYAVNFRKSRGTVLSPTVITTGDDLGTINFAGYVGGTNTFLNAAAIRATSTGTISDATNGIGGQVDIQTQKQGVDTSPQGRVRVDQLGHIASIAGTANTPTIGACGTSPSLSGTDNAALITVGTGGSATSCAMNFGSTWATNAPVCIAQNDTDKVAYSISATTSAVTISAAAAITASSKFHVICFGRL